MFVGRRPPSIIGKDQEPGLLNGNSDHNVIETMLETSTNSVSSSSEGDPAESKAKLPEWAKHPAPWLEEMKLNQARRSLHTSPQEKLGLTSEKNDTDDKSKPFKKEPSPIDKSKSITNARVKTPTNEFPAIRNKPTVPIPNRPVSLTQTKVSPASNKTPSPMQKSENLDSTTGGYSSEQYAELEQRIAKLEELFEKQRQNYEAAIEELRGKLQIETEMRMTLQANFERFIQDSAIQQL